MLIELWKWFKNKFKFKVKLNYWANQNIWLYLIIILLTASKLIFHPPYCNYWLLWIGNIIFLVSIFGWKINEN